MAGILIYPNFRTVQLKFCKSWTFPNFRTISVYIDMNFGTLEVKMACYKIGPTKTLYDITNLGQHWIRYWLVACLAPSHYLNQCWLFAILNCSTRNKLQWKWNQNIIIFIKENASAMSSANCGPFCSDLNMLIHWGLKKHGQSWQIAFSISFTPT